MSTLRTHYHVIENTPGYLPDNDDPFITYDLAAAREDAQCIVDALTEHIEDWDSDDDPTDRESLVEISGSVNDGLVYVSRAGDTYDLGRAVQIIACTDAECAPVDDEGEDY